VDGDDQTYWAANDGVDHATLELDMPGPTEINSVVLEEPPSLAGHVQEYKVEAQVDSDWKLLAHGASIGEHKIDRFPKVTVWKVRLTILKSNPYPALRKFGLYLDKTSPPENFKSPGS
jgi:alpha-L-fucosidase